MGIVLAFAKITLKPVSQKLRARWSCDDISEPKLMILSAVVVQNTHPDTQGVLTTRTDI
jgi:hypothetical protein